MGDSCVCLSRKGGLDDLAWLCLAAPFCRTVRGHAMPCLPIRTYDLRNRSVRVAVWQGQRDHCVRCSIFMLFVLPFRIATIGSLHARCARRVRQFGHNLLPGFGALCVQA